MVETAVTDIVRSAVATDDPLAALYEIVVERLELCANGAALLSTCGDERLELGSSLLRTLRIVHVGHPLVSSGYELCRNMLVGLCLFEEVADALLHLLVAKNHTETELAEVLEQ